MARQQQQQLAAAAAATAAAPAAAADVPSTSTNGDERFARELQAMFDAE